MTVGEVCTRTVVTARADEHVADAARRMRDGYVSTLVVVDGDGKDHPIGILTDRDIVVSAVAQSPDKLESLFVEDVMTGDVVTARPSETLQAALTTMRSRGIRRLPVVTGDGLLEGLLVFDDVLEVMSEELSDLVGLVAREQKAVQMKGRCRMTHAATDQPSTCTISCPVCSSEGALLRHDVRSSLLYFCQRCQHEWQIDPADEPLQVGTAVSPGPLKGAI